MFSSRQPQPPASVRRMLEAKSAVENALNDYSAAFQAGDFTRAYQDMGVIQTFLGDMVQLEYDRRMEMNSRPGVR